MRPDDPSLGPTSITIACTTFEAIPRDKAATLAKKQPITRLVADAPAKLGASG